MSPIKVLTNIFLYTTEILFIDDLEMESTIHLVNRKIVKRKNKKETTEILFYHDNSYNSLVKV